MKAFQAIAASSVFVAATVGAHAASFTGQTVDGVLSSFETVTTQFTSPIIAPGAFDGVMHDVFGQTWDISVQILSTEVIIEWTGGGAAGNVGGPADLLAVDLSGYANGPVLGLDSYSCTPSDACTASGPGPSISSLTSTPTSFDVSFDTLRSGETYVFSAAVPEPATWAMMGLGFAGLAFAGLRARRSASAIA